MRSSLHSLIIDDGVKRIIGELSSSITEAMSSEVTKNAGVHHCTGASTSPAISEHDEGGYSSRPVISDAYQGRVLVELFTEEGHTKVAMLYEEGACGQGLHDVFSESFEEDGGEIVAALSHGAEAEDADADMPGVKVCVYGRGSDCSRTLISGTGGALAPTLRDLGAPLAMQGRALG